MEALRFLSLGKKMNKIKQNILYIQCMKFILIISGTVEVFYKKNIQKTLQTSHDSTSAGISIFIKLKAYGLQLYQKET